MKFFRILFLSGLVFTSTYSSTADVKQKVEVVFCIDLSGSTNGLLEEVRNNFWQIVAARNNYDLKIGVIGYARPSFGATSAYVKVLSDITYDYDKISHELNLMKINIEKGDQFIPNALYVATLGMHWSEDVRIKRIVYLVGNGVVQTGKFEITKACELAKQNNITIYPVYCHEYNGKPTDMAGWKGIARMNNVDLRDIKVSQEKRSYTLSGIDTGLALLNEKLAGTFVYYGNEGMRKFKMMNAVDTFCLRVSQHSFYSRCKIKTSANCNTEWATWDLTSLMKLRQPDFAALDRKLLPKQWQNTDVKTLAKMLQEKNEERNYVLTQMRNSLGKITFPINSTCQLDSIVSNFK